MSGGVAPACWRGEDARAIFVTEALEGRDSIFLATHSPITGFDVKGREAADIDTRDEEGVLEALSAPGRRHAFCVVQGEPGSGKSHLIRWLSVNWSVSGDVKLLLRRADGSLEGALRQLRERLGPEFESLFDKLGQRHRAAAQGRANIFASTLADTLQPGHFDKPMPDEDWCRAFAPAELLGLPMVKQAWGGPARILGLLEGAGGKRDSATAAFDLDDMEELARASTRVRPGLLDARAQDLQSRLQQEAETIRAYREQDWRADELARDAGEHFPASLALIEALNRRRNDAIQNVLGVSPEALKTLFRTVREKLAERGERLVLLLEDITSWEGLDDSLIDVLVFNAEARGDEGTAEVCPLISVVGVTPEYYDKLQANYRQRITHEIILGTATAGLQDVAALRDPNDRRRFAARYLAAVRAGPAALERWRAEAGPNEQASPPNVCGTCPRRPGCFATFGEEDGIGLFPFTAHAFERFFDSLNENDRGQTWRTPRGILQAILYPGLAQPDALAAGRFPTPLVESIGIREDRRSDAVLSNRLEQIVANRGLPPEEEERIRRTLAFWGEPARPDTREIEGELAFAGVRRSLFDAFGLDWIGDDAPGEAAEPTGFEPPPPEAPIVLLPPEEPKEERSPSQSVDSRSRTALRPAPPIIPPKPKRLGVNRSELEQLQVELRAWAKGGAVANANRWNRILFELVEKVDTRRFGVSRPLFLRIVTPERVKLQGSTGGLRDYLQVDAVPWVRNGFEAYLALRLDRALSRPDAEFHRAHLALMLRRLEFLVGTYLRRRIPSLEGGALWSPAAAIAQALTARAWLRGSLDPRAPIAKHLQALLSDEPDPESDPKARSAPWQEWLNATDNLHGKLRAELRSLVTLATSDSGGGGAGLVDSSEIAGAIERLRQSGRPDEVPATNGGLPEMLRRARELAAHWVEKRGRIERTEADLLRNRAANLHGMLRGRSIAGHLTRLREAVQTVATLMPGAAAESVSQWLAQCDRAELRVAEGRDKAVEKLISALGEGSPGMPVKTAEKLGWMAAAPARDLQEFLEAAAAGEKLVESLYAHARDCIDEAAGAGSLREVQAAGSRLKAASGLGGDGEPAP